MHGLEIVPPYIPQLVVEVRDSVLRNLLHEAKPSAAIAMREKGIVG